METDIVRNGCHDPVKLWQGILVDGLNRIRICKNHKIPYQTEELFFNDRDEVIAYIASIQLLRSDVPEETRRYLIGKRFEAEKAVAHRQKISDWNLYTRNADIHGLAYRVFNPAQLPRPNQSIRTPAAFRLANEYCVSADTIDKYGRCAKAIDIIAEKDIALAKMLVSGKYRIAQSVIVAIAKRTPQEMEKIRKNIAAEEPLGEGIVVLRHVIGYRIHIHRFHPHHTPEECKFCSSFFPLTRSEKLHRNRHILHLPAWLPG